MTKVKDGAASVSAVPASIPSATHTPGPWAWFGNRSGGVYLATTHSGRRYVMGFRRYGMNGAQPSFCVGSIMVPAAELVQFAVGDQSVRGFKEADKDTSVYRFDIRGIDNADARLIAAAPCGLDAAQKVVSALKGRVHSRDALEAIAACEAFIEKATDAQAMAARSGETGTGSTVGNSAVPQECAQPSPPSNSETDNVG